MKASASQLDLPLDYGLTASVRSKPDSGAGDKSGWAIHDSNLTIGPIKEPSLSGFVNADTSRRAGRLNAASISKEKQEALLRERANLVEKEFLGQIDRLQRNRLAYVRWQLDRIEDAKFGPYYDQIESAVERYEYFLAEIQSLREQIGGISK